jgi:hypothetical protein
MDEAGHAAAVTMLSVSGVPASRVNELVAKLSEGNERDESS